jgi:geranylgeranyl diphosphate synthase type II
MTATQGTSPAEPAAPRPPPAKAGRFVVPPAAEWPALQAAVAAFAASRDLAPPLSFDELSEQAGVLIAASALPAAYREFIVVMINNALWADVVASIPFKRRTLLLPPCLRSSAACRARFDEYGLLCEECGQCCIGPLTREAEALGYAVLVAEGTSIVEKFLDQGSMDAVIGVSCMPSLERSFPRMADHAVPGLAIPLLQEGCQDTRVIEEWVRQTIHLHTDGQGSGYIDFRALHTQVGDWFTGPAIRETLQADASDTARLSIDWLTRSGKRWRPFLTVAAHMALTHGRPSSIPPAARRLAVAVECLHKASLVFDDIQDGDAVRYGEPTLHAAQGAPMAITAGLYLLGQGYRLVAECGAPPEQVAAMVRLTSEGHRDLCLGQGSELWWTRHPRLLSSAEVLDMFRFKTAPAFEVGLRLGAILGGATAEEHAILAAFSQNIGMAYQIRDDLEDVDGRGDTDDIRAGRPSILMALAAERADDRTRACIEQAWAQRNVVQTEIVRRLIDDVGAVDLARQALQQHKDRALAALRPLRNRELKVLLHRLAGAMTKRAEEKPAA